MPRRAASAAWSSRRRPRGCVRRGCRTPRSSARPWPSSPPRRARTAAFDDAAREAAVRFDSAVSSGWSGAADLGLAAPVAVAAALAAVLRGARGLRAGLAAVAASDASDSSPAAFDAPARLRRRRRGAGRLRGRGLGRPRPRRTRLRGGLRRRRVVRGSARIGARRRCSRGASRSPAARAARSTTPERQTPPCRCLRELRRQSLSAKRKSPRQPTNHDPPNPVATSPEDVEAVHSLSVASRSHYDPLPCLGVWRGRPISCNPT